MGACQHFNKRRKKSIKANKIIPFIAPILSIRSDKLLKTNLFFVQHIIKHNEPRKYKDE